MVDAISGAALALVGGVEAASGRYRCTSLMRIHQSGLVPIVAISKRLDHFSFARLYASREVTVCSSLPLP